MYMNWAGEKFSNMFKSMEHVKNKMIQNCSTKNWRGSLSAWRKNWEGIWYYYIQDRGSNHHL